VTQLTVAPTSAKLSCSTSEQVPHAPWLAATGPYLKTLECLSDPTALSLLTQALVFRNLVFDCSVRSEDCIRGDAALFQVVINVADLVLINAPKNFSLNICRESNTLVLANADDLAASCSSSCGTLSRLRIVSRVELPFSRSTSVTEIQW